MNVDERFRSLQRAGAPDLWRDIAARDPRPPEPSGPGPGRRVTIAVFAFVVAAGAFAFAAIALRERSAPADDPTPGTGSPAGSVAPHVSTVASVPHASAMAFGAGSLWVTAMSNAGDFTGHVLRFDPRTGDTIADIPTVTTPTWEVGGGGIAATDDAVWIVGGSDTGGGVNSPGGGADALAVRIDPATNEVVAEVPLGGFVAADVAVDDQGVWVMYFGDDLQSGRMQVARIDPVTNEVVQTIPLDSTYGHFLLAVGDRVIAVTNASGDGSPVGSSLTIFDPGTGEIVRSLDAGTSLWPAAGDGELWAATDRGLASIAPTTGDETASYPVAVTGDSLAVGAGGVWFLDPRNRSGVRRFDPSTDEVDLDVELDRGTSPNVLLAASDAVWVLTYEGDLVRIGLG